MQTELGRHGLSLERNRVEFGPFRFSEAIPWLLIASALRVLLYERAIALSIVAIVLMQMAIFMAFAAVAHSTVKSSGGDSKLEGLSLLGKVFLMKRVMKKTIKFQVILILATSVLGHVLFDLVGLDTKGISHLAINFFWSFTGMIYTDGFLGARVGSALVAVVTFLLVIAAASNRPVKLREVLRNLKQHWFAMALAIALLVQSMHFINVNQLEFLRFLMAYDLGDIRINAVIYVIYQTVFAFFRLYLTMLILTYLLRWSYKRQGQLS